MPRDDVLGTLSRGIDPSAPVAHFTEWWQLEIQWLPVGIHDRVNVDSLVRQLCVKSDAVRVVSPVRVVRALRRATIAAPAQATH